jgi:hypothetical protein
LAASINFSDRDFKGDLLVIALLVPLFLGVVIVCVMGCVLEDILDPGVEDLDVLVLGDQLPEQVVLHSLQHLDLYVLVFDLLALLGDQFGVVDLQGDVD